MTRIMTVAAVSLCLGMLTLALFLILREQKRRVASEGLVNASNVDLARSLDDSRRLGETLQQLSDLGHMLQGCRSLDEAVIGLQAAAENLFSGAAGAINLMNASQNLIAPISAWGNPVGGDPVFAPDDCWALRLGHPFPEERSTTALTCNHLQTEDARDVRGHLCIPLFAQGAMLGTLLLTQHKPIDSDMRAAAIAAAEQISLAIANLKLQETLRTQSLRDALTGFFNRRYLEVSLARDLTRAIRRNQPLAVIMLDIDHFKRFNDTHGHDAGDALLAQFGELLTTLVRSEDVACRYGGEEFTIVMQEADAALALDRAEEIRKEVAALDVLHRGHSLGQVTISIGIASYPQHGDSLDLLLRRADQALYAAKNSGRDQVCVADRCRSA
jgi:diguanylate cyclase (GGDEF)-like protein